MIDLYYWPTPNGHKVSIMLEEVGLAYQVHPVNILRGDQFDDAFLKISPNNRIPAIVDPDGPDSQSISIFESGAILLYLAEKTGLLCPPDATGRYQVLQWLMFQMGNVGPMFGQCGHFFGYAPEEIPYAKERYYKETKRLYGVMDRALADREYLAGPDCSIADIATYPWCMPVIRELHRIEVEDFPNVHRWCETMAVRPAVARGAGVLADVMKIGDPDDDARDALFGDRQQ